MPKKPSKPRKGEPLASSEKGVIYARYSSHAQKDASIEQQVSEAQSYAAEHGIPIYEVYADRAISGKTDRRPNFQKMMKDAEKGKFQYVIAWKSNRMGRNMLNAMMNEAKLQEMGIRVLYTEENFDDTAAGRFALRSMMNVNQFYSENMAEDIRRGLRDNAMNCKVTNGNLPFGYKKGEDLRYELDPPKDDIVREIFGRVACGEAFVDIANDLNARGIKTVRGNRWGKGSFHAMLVNERYRGIYIYDDIRIEGGVPRIVSDELFFKVQEVLKTKKNPQGRHRINGDYLLTGKLFCGKCKSPMVGISGTSKTGDLHYYYSCQKRRTEKTCSKANVRRDAIEEAVARAIKEYALQDDVIEWIADSTVAYNRRQEEQSHISILEDELTETKRAIKNIMAAIEQGIITDSTKGRLLELEAEQARLTGQIAASRADIITVSRQDVIDGLKMFRDLNVEDKKSQAKLFDAFLVAVYVYDDDLKIVFSFSGQKNVVSVPIDASLVDKIESNAEGKVRIDALLSHQLALTKKMQARIPHFGAGFLY
jgi:site-specific DNA recombinase